MALIELDVDRPGPAPASLPPAHRYRAAGLLLTAVLVLALAGAVPAQAVFWRHSGLVPLSAAADFQVAGGRLFTLEVTGGRRVTSAWTMRPLHRLWRAVTTADDTTGGLGPGGSTVSVAGPVVLLRSGPATTVLDAHSGAVRWTSPLPVLALSDTVGMVQDEQFRPRTEYDESSGAAGPLFFSSAGLPHTEPPLRTVLTGVDLRTGRPVWTAGFPGSIYPAKAHGRADALVVVASDRLWLRAAGTGAVLADRALPPVAGGGPSWGDVVGNLLFVRQAGSVTAYTMALDRLWQRPEPADPGNSASCTGLTCEKIRDKLVVLDPRTGRPRWQITDDVDLQAGAGYALQVQGGQSRPLRAVDAASGAPRVDLSDWQTFAPATAGAPVVLSRRVPGRGTEFGVLQPGRAAVRPLGTSRTPVTDCYADTRFVACRAAVGIDVFAYAG